MAEAVQTSRERLAQRYSRYKSDHPAVSFAEWMGMLQVDSITSGRDHATLGPHLRKHANWWDAGANTFRRYCSWFPIAPRSKVVDYGCGSLRVGGHFIRYLDPDGYFGLDVVSRFIDMGKDLVGPALLEEKRPRFALTDTASVMEATAFDANIVYSSAVSYHVHPEEAPLYFHNLAQIACKPGATLFFDVSVSDAPVESLQLSMPLGYFKQSLPGLEFLSFKEIDRGKDHNQIIGVLEFRRPRLPPKKELMS